MLDATFGRGGHTQMIFQHQAHLSVIAMDCDISAVQWGLKHIQPLFPKNLNLFHSNFHQYSVLRKKCFPNFIKNEGFDIIIVDLGPSSPQLDQKERGFSVYKDGPLDMRMDRTQHFSAADIINTWSEKELKNLFCTYGEIYNSDSVIKAILRTRKGQPFQRTRKLSGLIEKEVGWRRKGFHPASKYFLALRLKVNNELDGLKTALPEMIQSLNIKGRLFVLTFHSLEDRIVKNIFKANQQLGYLVNKKVIRPCRDEIKRNPRARSAKMRVFEKGQSP